MDNTTVFLPANALTFSTVENERKQLMNFCRNLESSHFTIDLTKVKKWDSAGLAFLIEAKRISTKHKKNCEIDHVSSPLLALAQFCGVEAILE